MKRATITAVAVALFLIGCQSTVRPEVAVQQDCRLVVRLSSDAFDNSGLVRPSFEGLPEIDGRFEVKRIDVSSDALPRTQRLARWRGTSQRYPLTFGLPGTAWRQAGQRIDEYSYEIAPGKYQIVVRYRASVSRAMCVASSDVFSLKNPTLWLVTN